MNLQSTIVVTFYFKMNFILIDCLNLDCCFLIIPGNFVNFHLFRFEAVVNSAKSFLMFHLIFENLVIIFSYKSTVIGSISFGFAIANYIKAIMKYPRSLLHPDFALILPLLTIEELKFG